MKLPSWIGDRLAAMLEGASRRDLAGRAEALSRRYRGGGTSAPIAGEADALAYALARMPATYAAVRAAFSAAAELADFAPGSVLDVGAGAGAASWAALEAWPSIARAHLLDRNESLLGLARRLSEGEGAPGADFAFTLATMEQGLEAAPEADLAVASYALTELPMAEAVDAARALWRRAREMLAIVEPGTPDGFARILAYRDALIGEGAHILAPCTHEAACPLAGAARWCHFSQRLARSRDHLALKDARVPYEDEKYSYLVAARTLRRPEGVRRVLATPNVNKARVVLDLCAPGAVEQRVVERRAGEEYKIAKRADWGDLV